MAEIGCVAAALTGWSTAVLECSEDHLDVLLTFHSVKGERLTGHRRHGSSVFQALSGIDSITAPDLMKM